MWTILKKNVIRRHPKNKEELWEILAEEEWSKVDVSEIRVLYTIVPRSTEVLLIKDINCVLIYCV